MHDYIHFNLDSKWASASLSTLVPQYDPQVLDINGRFTFGLISYLNVTATQILTLESTRSKNGIVYDGIIKYDINSLSSLALIKIK